MNQIAWKCPKCKKAVTTPQDSNIGPFVVLMHECGFTGYITEIKHEIKAEGKRRR